MTYKTPFEKALERADELMAGVDRQRKLIAGATKSVSKLFEGGDLEKLAGAT